MLSRDFGRLVRDRRIELGIAQAALARRTGISRSVISKLESGRGAPVQTDVLDKLLDGLGTRAAITSQASSVSAAMVERLQHRLRQEELRQRHLRLALELCLRPAPEARRLIHRARNLVDVWEQRKSCSRRYVDGWRRALCGSPREVARAMLAFGEWENAMYQNTPWAFTWK